MGASNKTDKLVYTMISGEKINSWLGAHIIWGSFHIDIMDIDILIFCMYIISQTTYHIIPVCKYVHHVFVHGYIQW